MKEREPKNIIGDRIRIARTLSRPPMDQKDLLAKLDLQGMNISESMLSKIETGDRLVKDNEIVEIGKALKVSIIWLLGLNKDTGERPEIG